MAGEYVLFGAGRIGSIRSEIDSKLTNYYADIDIYCPFDPPVSAREIKQDISFLQGKEGLNGVPQNSIYQIERKDYLKILESAGELDLLSTE